MTKEEAIRHIRDVINIENNSIKPIVIFEQEKEALYMAIEALQNLSKPNNELQGSDLIRREDAIKAGANFLWHYPNDRYKDLNVFEVGEEIVKDALSILPSAEAIQGWIPVTERLPEDEKSVLVTDDEGFVHMMHYEYIPHGGYWFTTEEGILVEESDIIAWMPLPPAYQGEWQVRSKRK